MLSDKLQYALEELVDANGLSAVLEELANTCQHKAAHIRESYGDKLLPLAWETAADTLIKTAATRSILLVSP